jgi:hypothetical protein
MKAGHQIVTMAPPGSYRQQIDRNDSPSEEDAITQQLLAAQMRAETRKENLGLCCNICVFLIYLLVFSIAMLLEQSDTSSYLADHIRAMLAGGGPNHHANMALKRIDTTEDVYSFLEDVFVPSLWENNTDTNQALKISTELHPIDTANRLMGAARVRQVRVKEEQGCQVGPMFAKYNVACYPMFNAGGFLTETNEETQAFGPQSKYTWKDDKFGTGYSGSMGVYTAGGYSQFLSTNRTAALETIKDMRADKFLGYSTRAVFVDFTVWNSNVGAYGVMRVAIEFSPAGTVAQHLEASVLSQAQLTPGGHGSSKEWSAFIFVIVVMLFVIYYMAEELQEIYVSKLSYFTDGWNVLDWINMILLIVGFIIRCIVYSDASDAKNLGSAQIKYKDAYSSVKALASKAELVRLLNAFNAVLLWGKCVKYFRHLPIVKVLVKTVWNAFSLFLPFMIMFLVALIGFTMSYNLGFGDKIQELTTFTRAIVYLLRAFLKDIELMPVYHITPLFGAMLILLFYVLMILVAVNVLFAIMADAMFRAKCHPEDFEDDPEHHDEPLEELLRELKKLGLNCIHFCCPWVYKKVFKKPSDKHKLLAQNGGDGGDDEKPP